MGGSGSSEECVDDLKFDNFNLAFLWPLLEHNEDSSSYLGLDLKPKLPISASPISLMPSLAPEW